MISAKVAPSTVNDVPQFPYGLTVLLGVAIVGVLVLKSKISVGLAPTA